VSESSDTGKGSGFGRWLRLGIGGLLLGWLLSRVGGEELGAALLGAAPLPLFAALLAFVALISLQGERLSQLGGGAIRAREGASLQLRGIFFNNFLPTNVGGDGYKVAALVARGLDWTRAGLIVGTDRLWSLGAVAVAGIAVLPALGPRLTTDLAGFPPWAIAAVLAVGVAGLSAAFWLLARRVRRRSGGEPLPRLGGTKLARVAALSAAAVGVRLGRFAALGAALTVDLTLGEWVLVIVVLNLTALLPFTPGALGIQEGAIVALLLALGADSDSATALALINRAITWLGALVGGLIWLRGRRDSPAPTSG